MIARSTKLPKGSYFLFGPSGTGKSTWIEAELPDALCVDLLDQATFLELTGHAERLTLERHGAARGAARTRTAATCATSIAWRRLSARAQGKASPWPKIC